jgi:ankyrin repeat protein
MSGNVDVLQEISDLAKNYLATEEIQNNVLITTNNKGNTAWHFAAMSGNVDVLQEISDLANNHLTTDEIKNKLLFATNTEGTTARH